MADRTRRVSTDATPPDTRRGFERSGDRRQRIVDASRVLSALATILFVFPLPGLVLEPGAPEETRIGAVYLFAVWFALILATWALSRALGKEPVDD